MAPERDNYASYLLRLWRSEREGRLTWRASLEGTLDGQRIEFGSVEALVAYLIARFGSTQRGAAGEEGERQDPESGG